ncbi:carotenoid oxygenase family protein [Geminocystis sp. NIES-3709]|uniref:carotenoid oxygenase family protein n=1 Tax=Geminocystis sp. NIES-3709 TaxID=1617448 RepID=UPI0005FC67BB|nr:carotenoid oxygenase family protein [Geminocystis sp. NIES-3709]BAQ65924.1 retinal pigment epithelial membrane protein [Geminocystis sp. NIES-3709]
MRSLEKLSYSYSLSDWRQGYESQPQESEYIIDNIEGEIPVDLSGTLYRNGPGLLEIYDTPLQHPFDGDGMICSFSFDNGQCFFRNRFVKTREYIEEHKAGKMLYRGVFGSQKPGGWLANLFDIRVKNIANTNVIYWGNKLLALWEAAQPYSLNPENLETIGLDNLEGTLQQEDVFSAHPRIDRQSLFNHGKPSLVNFGIKPGLSSTITVYEFDELGKIIDRYSHITKGFSFIHDFVITPNYCIFFQNPTTYNPLPFIFGLRGAGECVNFESNKPTKIILIPRNTPHDQIITLEVEAGFIFHHSNAFEVNNTEIIIDSICYSQLSQIDPKSSYKEVDFDKLAPGQLWRFKLNLTTKQVIKELINPRCVEFPSINSENVGRNYRYIFIGASDHPTKNAPLQALLKLDLITKQEQLYSFAPKGFTGEPVFIPKKNPESEDDGWVLTLVYDSTYHRSDLVIFDGKNISQPIATLHLKQHIPYGLHGSWKEKNN